MTLDFTENIVIGRTQKQFEKYGEKATGYIGKVVVSSGDDPVLGKKVLMDISRSHVMIVCGKRGGGKCVTGDTLVALDDGTELPIKDIEKSNNKILSINNNLKINKKKKNKFFKRTVDKIMKVKLRSGKEIELTPEHPLLTITGWVDIQNLKVGSRIATPRKLNNLGKKTLSEDKIKLIAYLLAEGHLSNRVILFCNSDKKILLDFKNTIEKFNNELDLKKMGLYNYKVIWKKEKKEKNTKNTLKEYLKEIKMYNKLAHEKEIPEIIFQLNKKSIQLFLNRLFSCDGSIFFEKDRCRISYSSSSNKMIKQVQSLLLKLEILSKIRTKKTKVRPNYELEIFEQDVNKYCKEIGFCGKKEERNNQIKIKKINNSNIDTIPKEIWNAFKPKSWKELGDKFNYKVPKALRSSINYAPSRSKLLTIANKEKNKDLKKIAESDIFWDEIKSIEIKNGKFEVYDISVPKDYNFIANNIIIHNSYTLSVIIEEMARQPFEIKERLSTIVIDTVGIFWTMKFGNKEGKDYLSSWDLKPEGIEIRNMIPFGKQEFYKEKKIPFDQPFSLRTSQMDLEDWLGVFRLTWKDPESALLHRTLEIIKEKLGSLFDIDDIIKVCLTDEDTSQDIKNSLINRMKVAKSWGLFSKVGTTTKEFARAGTLTVIDVSTYKQAIGMEAIKELIVGLLGKRLFEERMLYRKEEEMNLLSGRRKESEMPIVWMVIDEAHMFMPQDRPSMALDVLLDWIRVGRQPGLSLILATQRPNKLHSEAISQCDLFLSMRMTAQEDINAVATIRPSYLNVPMDKFYAQMPKSQGYAILVDDNSEKVMLIKIRPRLTWDGGKTANVFTD
ncbi:MAG: LAGLIDADG family homing endonuclease, partial [Candidatus ainarchaeum sp.]|nr:LAGLIDADG family homing endonuclease [Candidatus ainarchaeum sp.]